MLVYITVLMAVMAIASMARLRLANQRIKQLEATTEGDSALEVLGKIPAGDYQLIKADPAGYAQALTEMQRELLNDRYQTERLEAMLAEATELRKRAAKCRKRHDERGETLATLQATSLEKEAAKLADHYHLAAPELPAIER